MKTINILLIMAGSILFGSCARHAVPASSETQASSVNTTATTNAQIQTREVSGNNAVNDVQSLSPATNVDVPKEIPAK